MVCDDKDLSWFNKRIKSLIQEGTLLLKTLQKNRNNVELLSSITFSKDNIAKIIQSLDPNKANGCDQVSIRMLKLRSTSIYKPLEFGMMASYLNWNKIAYLENYTDFYMTS